MSRTPKQELKAFDVATATTNFTAPGAFVRTLNVPINGPEIYQRVGRKIYMKSLHFRGFISNVATSIQDVARIIIFYDSQSNAGGVALADLLQDSNAAAATTGLSEINLINRERFKILRDQQFLLPSCTNAAGVLTNFTMTDPISHSFNIDMFIKLRGLETIFNATNGGTAADVSSGNLGVLFVTQNASNTWACTWNSRLRYYD